MIPPIQACCPARVTPRVSVETPDIRSAQPTAAASQTPLPAKPAITAPMMQNAPIQKIRTWWR